jgi:hypothetical protein
MKLARLLSRRFFCQEAVKELLGYPRLDQIVSAIYLGADVLESSGSARITASALPRLLRKSRWPRFRSFFWSASR